MMSGQVVKVLLIEDNPGDARLVQEMAKDSAAGRCEFEWVDRLSTGMERLSENIFDILLLDLGLPDSQGRDWPMRLWGSARSLPERRTI
jgi:DNA-binding response OmpR family regulator